LLGCAAIVPEVNAVEAMPIATKTRMSFVVKLNLSISLLSMRLH
jgi:hypothetical protein